MTTRLIKPDSTSQSITIHLSSATGDNLTGKVAADITATYRRGPIGTSVTITVVDLALVTTPYSSGGFVEIGSTANYRLDLPNAAIATGVDFVEVILAGSGIVQTGGAYVIDLLLANKPPRQNTPAGRAFNRSVSARSDGTHKVTAPIRIRAGTIGSIAVSVDMRPLFGNIIVQTVGTPTVSPTGGITVAATGPRDTEAMITIDGTAAASTTYLVTIPVTMDTGESVDVDVDVISFAE